MGKQITKKSQPAKPSGAGNCGCGCLPTKKG